MSKTYILTSDHFPGFVLFEFDPSGALIRYDMTEAQLSTEQKNFILHKLPKSLKDVKRVLGNSRTAKLQLQTAKAVSFDEFWNRYGEKTRSSKKKSQQKWNRMSQAQRDRAYNYITTYERHIPYGVSKKYAETYLNAELWNN